jgi:pullulanase-type alpha-1,6-glucosidase
LVFVVALFSTLLPMDPLRAQPADGPTTVTIPGTIQSILGCSGDWQPDCAATALQYDPAFDLWSAVFSLPAGAYEYKVALNGSWEENYGRNATRDGPNIPLSLAAPADVRFIYDHKTNGVADTVNSRFIVLAGDFQATLGCPANDDPTCLGSWLQDADGDGIYTWTSTALAAGTYTARLALDGTLEGALGADATPAGPPITLAVANTGDELYIGYDVNTASLIISTNGAPRGDLSRARAHWISRDTILWEQAATLGATFSLHYGLDSTLSLDPTGVQSEGALPLTAAPGDPAEAAARFPHLADLPALTLAPEDAARAPNLLRGALAVAAYTADGRLLDATRIQIPGILDDLFTYAGPLGVSWERDPNVAQEVFTPVFRLWAPTARAVNLLRFSSGAADGEPVETQPMLLDEATGVWQVAGGAEWRGDYYLYEVAVYAPSENAFVVNRVTDPYSFSLSTNSARSQIVDLADPALAPEGWDGLEKPAFEHPADAVLYELHVRDFSIFDEEVPADLRGTYMAFTVDDSAGMRHLRSLAEAGVSHVHLLPTFDIATIEEDRTRQVALPLAELAALPPDSPEQQALLNPIRDLDGFNWGYDPYHYTVPEGSYSTNPEGSARIGEFRSMVQALNRNGLRVVLDVVYNHTNAAGQSERSVLDRIVPGYYHRLDADGRVTNSTCCPNTASEHAMMEKLMIDSLRTWAHEYKVDGFRFDLMGHHMKRNMLAVREALDGLTPAQDGVDGKSIIIYGEGWNFGEVANNARGENAVQLNMGGTGIATFSDRLRDGVRGGGPFDNPQIQGFATGLFTDPSDYLGNGTPEAQRRRLLEYSDWIRVGLTGNLRDYIHTAANGREARGALIFYNGAPAGYTVDLHEQVVYVSAHDNETLFDAVQLKAPAGADVAERARMHNLALSITALSQGIPFIHAGDELLRSKSLDRNSYNSSDWFNRIDWTGQSNTFGSGLPPADDNESNWPIMAPLLANTALRPGPDLMLASAEHLREMLRIRGSTPLFRLRSGAEVQEKMRFFNVGPEQTPGLIVMAIADNGATRIDPNIGQVVALFNAAPEERTFSDPLFAGAQLHLHDVLVSSSDERVINASFDAASGVFTIPARTTAVFMGGEPLYAPPGANIDAPPGAQPEPGTDAPPGAQPEPGTDAPPERLDEPAPGNAIGINPVIVLAVIAGLAAAFFAIWRGRRLDT